MGDDETAFNGRTAGFTYNIGACTETSEGFDEEREWVRSFWSALEPWHEGVYVNFLGDEGAERVRQSYGPEKYDRLQALKQKYDPDNFFRINQNISPSRSAFSEQPLLGWEDNLFGVRKRHAPGYLLL